MQNVGQSKRCSPIEKSMGNEGNVATDPAGATSLAADNSGRLWANPIDEHTRKRKDCLTCQVFTLAKRKINNLRPDSGRIGSDFIAC